MLQIEPHTLKLFFLHHLNFHVSLFNNQEYFVKINKNLKCFVWNSAIYDN